MSILTNFNDWKAKLQRVDWIETDGSKKIIGNRAGNRVELVFETKLLSATGVAVQAILLVKLNGNQVAQWGAYSEENNKEVVAFFLETKASAQRTEYQLEQDIREEAETLWKNIF